MGDKNEKQCSSGHNMGLMIVGCIIMMGVFWFIAGRGGTGTGLYWPLLLICPLIHILMMFGLFKNSSKEDENKGKEENYNESSL